MRGQPSWAALSKDEAHATHSVLIKTFSGYFANLHNVTKVRRVTSEFHILWP